MRVILPPALRRSTIDDFLECGHAPGGYGYVLFEMRASDYVALSASTLRSRQLRARVRAGACPKRQKNRTVGRGVCGSSVDAGRDLELF